MEQWIYLATPNGVIREYSVRCRGAPCDARLSPAATRHTHHRLPPNTTIYFQVRAATDAGYGPYSDVVQAYSNDVNPIPKVMISTQESIKIIDLDSGDSETVPKSTGIPVDLAVAIEENIVYWVNNLDEIFSSRINGSGHSKVTSINGTLLSMCYDWASRAVYWAARAGGRHAVYSRQLTSGAPRPRRRVLDAARPAAPLLCHPHGSLYWYEESSNLGLGTLMTAKTDGTNIRPFFNTTRHANCNCPENPQVAKSFVIDMTNDTDELYWIDPWTNQIIASDMRACKCRVVVDGTEKKKYGFIPISIAVDSKYIYWFNATERMIYYTTKNRKSKIEQVKATYGYKIAALDPRTQPYPPRHCLYPWSNYLTPKMVSNSANSIALRLPDVGKPEQCKDRKYDMTASEYTVYYRLKSEDDGSACNKAVCKFIDTVDKEVEIGELLPFTNYSVSVEVTNYYAKLHEEKPTVGPAMTLQTAAEAPSPATDVTATVLSPVLARVEWTPEPGLWYELHWRTDHLPVLNNKYKEHNTFEVTEGRAANMTRLSPNTVYTVWIRARSNHSAVTVDSQSLRVKTYPLPQAIGLINATAYSATVAWHPPSGYTLYHYKVEYTEASSQQWLPCTKRAGGEWLASGLEPKTRYRFRLRLQYVASAPPYLWPHDDRYTFETLGDVPGAPGRVQAAAVGERVARLWWREPPPRGAPVDHYRLWGRQQTRVVNANSSNNLSSLPPDLPTDLREDLKKRILEEGLELLHNGTDSYWLIGEGELLSRYWVYVEAHNEHGWGALSERGDVEVWAGGAGGAGALKAALMALAAAALALPPLYLYNRRGKKKVLSDGAGAFPAGRRPDVELATLRQLPTRHSTNIIYNQGVHAPTDAELAALPHIRREQITLTKFLGSGAFGEVFEGVARALPLGNGDTKVAVKTLRKGATDQEKTEFLQEAALMSNFKHSHILRLLGVCLDNDPHYIIMELMEGGDLLSYLRAKRSALVSNYRLKADFKFIDRMFKFVKRSYFRA
ncbi:hypothetical protein JYU34_017413 [Plutella xylostella]|uniref:Receptor protein-tyrosine kinase n=1 Tax=Plutella xylostella TaxID=51655 RepID=A0ABQ7Q135_PLUXY|nr:hypothetical protein JYU34_017413 [Plutella xylostella]